MDFMTENSLDIEELKRSIRKEVEQRKLFQGINWAGSGYGKSKDVGLKDLRSIKPIEPLRLTFASGRKEVCSGRKNIHLNELLSFHDGSFLKNAYTCILGRGIDEQAMGYYLSCLREGKMTKAEIIGRIRYSPEGRKKAIAIKGLLPQFLIHLVFKVPVVGYVLRLFLSLARLPVITKNFQITEAYFHARSELTAVFLEQSLAEVQNRFNQVTTALSKVVNIISESAVDRTELASKADMKALNELDEKKADIAKLNEVVTSQGEIQRILTDISSRVDLLNNVIETIRKTSKALRETQTNDNTTTQISDVFYASFTDVFRGPKNAIKERAEVYLPHIEKACAGKHGWTVFDAGCGRGEWLELVKEKGLQAVGIESNHNFVEQCRDNNLNVIEGDAIEYLGASPDDFIGAVSAFHFIEHLPFYKLMLFLEQVFRTLRPGGLLLVETPNPKNLLVASCNFYVDPTHNKPLPPELLQYTLGALGFGIVETLFLQPFPAEYRFQNVDSLAFKRLDEAFFGPQDYGIVARKSEVLS